MNRDASIFLIDESEPCEHYRSNGAEIIESTIATPGKPLHLRIGIIDGPATLSDIVSLARSISDEQCLTVIDHLETNGQCVQCSKGCFACCGYLVTLSLPEVFRMQKELSAMGAGRYVSILYSCLDSSKKILDIDVLEEYNINEKPEMTQISKWYAELDLSCPFLSNGLCGIYEQRPLACREHMVTTSPQSCINNEMNTTEIVDMPVSILEALGQLAADLEQTEVEAVILPLALTCMDNYIQRSHRTWPAIAMAEHFVNILETIASKQIAAPAGSS